LRPHNDERLKNEGGMMTIDWEIVLSIATIATAVIALFMTFFQMQLSNKQSLFDKRIENYMIADELCVLYNDNRKSLLRLERDKFISSLDIMFRLIMQTACLEQATNVMISPNPPFAIKQFWETCEHLASSSAKTKFLFRNRKALVLSNFVIAYKELLVVMYRYKIAMDCMEEYKRVFDFTFEKAQETTDEPKKRKDVFSALDRIESLYTQIEEEKIREAIEKKIKLL
jgi:predicted nucleotidyltransferase